MKLILYATDTCKESVQSINEIGDFLYERGIKFQIDKRRMTLKTDNVLVVFVPETFRHSGLYQRHPFDYYILTGKAKYDCSGWQKKCISRTKHGSKQIRDEEELLEIVIGQ